MASCRKCNTQLGDEALSCLSCGALVHSHKLSQLASEAKDVEKTDPEAARALWRDALLLLPPQSKQYRKIEERVEKLSQEVEAQKASLAPKAVGIAGVAALFLWKFKFVLVGIFSKGKLVLMGLTKAGTLTSMLASLGVYWAAFGWVLAVGLIVSIYLHEMGHVVALQRCGVKAEAPMFIPALGAVIRSKHRPASAREDAYIGLAGPVWGLATALACLGLYYATGWGGWKAIAVWGALINLFNLIPLFSLDGARGLRALSKSQRWLLLGCMALGFYWTSSLMALVVMLVTLMVVAVAQAPSEGHTPSLVTFAILFLSLCWLGTLG